MSTRKKKASKRQWFDLNKGLLLALIVATVLFVIYVDIVIDLTEVR